MKTIYFIAILIMCGSIFGQIEQNVNKTTGTESNQIIEIDSIRFSPNQTEMEIILNNGTVLNHLIEDIDNVTFSGELVGLIVGLECSNTSVNGTLAEGAVANGITAEIDYSWGNGGSHNGDVVNSTGVTGLTAELFPGNFSVGAGTLTYEITGTPNSSGVAIFEINIGGESCTVELLVEAASVSTVDCINATVNGTFIEGVVANGIIVEVDYTGGNGGTYNGQTINSFGVIGLTAELAPGNLNVGAGTLIYEVSGTPNSSGIASFLIDIGGVTCTLELMVDTGSISTLDCASSTISGVLIDGVAASGVTAEINYTGGNGGSHNGQVVSSTGVTGLTAELASGNFNTGAGTLIYEITGTPSSDGTAEFLLDIGGETCTLEMIVDAGSISSLDCAAATINGGLIEGVTASGVSAEINYTGGNGGSHNGQTVASTGVTGLTAELVTGNFTTSTGSVVYEISGTPNSSGIANFSIDIGGETCVLEVNVLEAGVFPSNTVNCSGPTAVVDVTNPTTGRTWMDRNLGALKVADSTDDENAYGDLYQWGRLADGHQCRNSSTTSTTSSVDQPGHGDFILPGGSFPLDWRDPSNSNLWQGVFGVNNPCPTGYRVPTQAELSAEYSSWTTNDNIGAFNSPLKLTVGGFRSANINIIIGVGSSGDYWSSSFTGSMARHLYISSSNAEISTGDRADGASVRCLKH